MHASKEKRICSGKQLPITCAGHSRGVIQMNETSTSPIVSVLMTAYNREKYISQAIESVLRSSLTNFELIIVDDVSKDRTVEIARNYAAKDNRVLVFVNEKNLGDYGNR